MIGVSIFSFNNNNKKKNPKNQWVPWWFSGKEFTYDAGEDGLIPGWGSFPGGGNPMNRGLAGHSQWALKRVGHDLLNK